MGNNYRMLCELSNGERAYTTEWMVFTMQDGQSWIIAHAATRPSYEGGTMKMEVVRTADNEVVVYANKPEYSFNNYTAGFERGEFSAFRVVFKKHSPAILWLQRIFG